jgi:hypothetical protein
MIIGDMTALSACQDKGDLWEKFLIPERLKQNPYSM